MNDMEDDGKMIEIPKWIIEKAMDVLEMNYVKIDYGCRLKRQTADSYNMLGAFLNGVPSYDELNKISLYYIDGKLNKR